MDIPFQVFLCLLFGVVCVVFICWVFRQGSDPGFITTTEYTVPVAQTGETVQSPAFNPPYGDISFTNMRLLTYYAHIAVVAVSGFGKHSEDDIPSIREKASEMVLAFCQVDGYEIDDAARTAIPYIVDYRIKEQNAPIF